MKEFYRKCSQSFGNIFNFLKIVAQLEIKKKFFTKCSSLKTQENLLQKYFKKLTNLYIKCDYFSNVINLKLFNLA